MTRILVGPKLVGRRAGPARRHRQLVRRDGGAGDDARLGGRERHAVPGEVPVPHYGCGVGRDGGEGQEGRQEGGGGEGEGRRSEGQEEEDAAQEVVGIPSMLAASYTEIKQKIWLLSISFLPVAKPSG